MSGALFQYSVRESPKAKNVRLRVSMQKGLEVIVPRGYETARIPDLLERKRHWIRTAERVNKNETLLERI
jgi:predicted metal-dependent hydrolase